MPFIGNFKLNKMWQFIPDEEELNQSIQKGKKSKIAKDEMLEKLQQNLQNYLDSIERSIALFHGPNIVKMARTSAKDANQYTVDNTPLFTGHLLIYGREILDPFFSGLYSDWPRFSHDITIDVIQKSSIIGGPEKSLPLRISHSSFVDDPNVVDHGAYSVMTNTLRCQQSPQLEVQITYESIWEVGLPDIEVYLFKPEFSHTQEKIVDHMKIRQEYANGKISYTEKMKRIYGEPLESGITDEKGYIKFTTLCDGYYSGEQQYLIISLIPDPEIAIHTLEDYYGIFQKALAHGLDSIWKKHKPIWEAIGIRYKNSLLLAPLGIMEGAYDYPTELPKKAWDAIYDKINSMVNPVAFPSETLKDAFDNLYQKDNVEANIAYIDRTISQSNGSDGDSIIEKYLKKLGVSRDEISIGWDEAKKNLNRVTLFLSDEAMVFFTFKTTLLTLRMQSDPEIQKKLHTMLPKLLATLFIGMVVLAAAKKTKIPKKAFYFILIYNTLNLTNTTVEIVNALKELTEDIEFIEEIFKTHIEKISELSAKIRTHGLTQTPNKRNIHTTNPWVIKNPDQNNNINTPNALG